MIIGTWILSVSLAGVLLALTAAWLINLWDKWQDEKQKKKDE